MVSYDSICVYWRWPSSLRKLQIALVVCSAFLVHLSLGTIYTYGNMVPYIVSYIRVYSYPPDLKTTSAPYILTFQIAGQGLTMFAGGYLERRFGPRLTTLAGGWLMSLGVLLTYFTIKVSYWLVVLTYGAVFGAGVGLAYIGPIVCVMRWLPKWKGISSGIVVAGFGLSALIFDLMQTLFINPRNLKPYMDESGEKHFDQEELLNRVPYVFLVLGATFAIMQLAGCIFLVNPPPNPQPESSLVPGNNLSSSIKRGSVSECNVSLQNQGASAMHSSEKPEEGETHSFVPSSESAPLVRRQPLLTTSVAPDSEHSTTNGSSQSVYKICNLTPLQMLTKTNFYLLWVMFMLGGTCISLVNSLYKSFAFAAVTTDDQFLAVIGAVSSLFNLAGRIAWGLLADVVSYKLAMVIHAACMTCLLFTFYATSAGGEGMFAFWLCGIFFCVGGFFSLFPTATVRSFGLRYIGINYGLVFTAQMVAGLITALLSNYLSDHIGWYGLFFVLGGLSMLEYVLTICYRHKRYVLLRKPSVLQESASKFESSSIKFPMSE